MVHTAQNPTLSAAMLHVERHDALAAVAQPRPSPVASWCGADGQCVSFLISLVKGSLADLCEAAALDVFELLHQHLVAVRLQKARKRLGFGRPKP